MMLLICRHDDHRVSTSEKDPRRRHAKNEGARRLRVMYQLIANVVRTYKTGHELKRVKLQRARDHVSRKIPSRR